MTASLLWISATALAGEEAKFTRLVIPVVNQNELMVLLDLDGTVTTPGRRYLDAGHSVTLKTSDPALDGQRLEYQHTLDISRVDQGIEPWCRVKIKTVNDAGRPGSVLTYCSAASSDQRCALQVYNEAQVCWVLVTVH
ncbi:MAG: hypothetical protein KJ720_08595 [Proteobacteria bacterium]|nr:hypothetical protein [Pseudomonadota bacterium]MBU1451814.1 hypothetical protein [Pseudomonadota bacterium]MBU2470695.1 hypothetical protein [Pseudomonadota bacterium]MBU2516526.1 hypothetical protein [Pseudomonadota bacterium]